MCWGSDGHPFKCLQQVIEIRGAKSVDRAVQTAERQYQGLRGLRDWRLHADYLELEIDGKKVSSSEELANVIGSKSPGQKVKITYLRPKASGGYEKRTAEVTLGSRPLTGPKFSQTSPLNRRICNSSTGK